MSQRPGSTVMPSVEMTSAPGGTASDPTWPTATIRSPSMRIDAVVDRRAAVAVDERAADERGEASR